MGARKKKAADARKELMKSTYVAKLNNCPTSPRKMRLVADMIRGKKVDQALGLLKFSKKEAAGNMHKLLLSAINNWQAKNEGVRIEDETLVVSQVFVDSARQLKRLRPAPQGRGYRIRKRSNHVTLFVDTINKKENKEQVTENTEA
ncbi:MAG TPA: 50S ribosomal protein L22 [Bacteroidia bacterium]|nr:MAG: 50S ribosomal protein L22 [Bacteroidetes bacterium OLB10]MBE7509284.1 50S ribosomal protein L22 [Bacteroidia bacterium]MBX3106391.1 50S ribosomal protein L22 [Bacteroidota bacterium]MCE7954225.1 50S ribosomal protein L22 [Bacteroidetes bacterium CHB6]OQB64383.1 MAG: 50S ribosomal protein L22 [Bacteroidetes bacterium ADurb.Bin141]